MAEDTTSRDSDGAGPDDLDAIADRLEAALERIVQHLDAGRPPAALAARLDRLIGRLRDVLGSVPETD